jgi:hypothetical protein
VGKSGRWKQLATKFSRNFRPDCPLVLNVVPILRLIIVVPLVLSMFLLMMICLMSMLCEIVVL